MMTLHHLCRLWLVVVLAAAGPAWSQSKTVPAPSGFVKQYVGGNSSPTVLYNPPIPPEAGWSMHFDAAGLPIQQPISDGVGVDRFAIRLPLLESELEPAEQVVVERLLARFTLTELTSLNQFVQAQPEGDRGAFMRQLLDRPEPAQMAMLRLLTQVKEQTVRQHLAAALALRKVDTQWPALVDLAVAVEPHIAIQIFNRVINRVDSQVKSACEQAQADRQLACKAAERDFVTIFTPAVRGVNMRKALPGTAPWQAQIFFAGEQAKALTSPLARSRDRSVIGVLRNDFERLHLCGAVNLGNQWVLTAAHCIGDVWKGRNGLFFDYRRVRLGTQDIDNRGQVWAVAAVVRHGRYQSARKGNDIALLKLKGPPQGRSDEPIRSIPLATQPAPLRTELHFTGWGVTGQTESGGSDFDAKGNFQKAERLLRVGTLTRRPESDCNDNKNFKAKGYAMVPGQICAGSDRGTDACRGDSGGPLVWQRPEGKAVLVGLVSYGPGCGLPGTPGLYTDVRFFADWIEGAKARAQEGRILDYADGQCWHDGVPIPCTPQSTPQPRAIR